MKSAWITAHDSIVRRLEEYGIFRPPTEDELIEELETMRSKGDIELLSIVTESEGVRDRILGGAA